MKRREANKENEVSEGCEASGECGRERAEQVHRMEIEVSDDCEETECMKNKEKKYSCVKQN
jgi:hypothetical protein